MNYIDCRTDVIGNLIDDSLFGIRESVNDSFTILTVTYDSQIKGNHTLFRALREMVKRGVTDFRIIIIGANFKGRDIPATENPFYASLENYGLLSHAELKSFVPKEDMKAYYNKSSVFVSTSIAETFGMAQCEAMMCGIPVIATANGGIDDFYHR